MTRFAQLGLLALLAQGAWAQSAAPQPPASTEDVKFFRYLLFMLANPSDQQLLRMQTDAVVKQFGLNQQEITIVTAAGQSFQATLQGVRAKTAAITSGKQGLSPVDQATISALSATLDEAVSTLANQIFNSVLPETANRLRVPGRIVGKAVAAAKGVN